MSGRVSILGTNVTWVESTKDLEAKLIASMHKFDVHKVDAVLDVSSVWHVILHDLLVITASQECWCSKNPPQKWGR
jgi:hypothetical protein